jgi:hypothetical protein
MIFSKVTNSEIICQFLRYFTIRIVSSIFHKNEPPNYSGAVKIKYQQAYPTQSHDLDLPHPPLQ